MKLWESKGSCSKFTAECLGQVLGSCGAKWCEGGLNGLGTGHWALHSPHTLPQIAIPKGETLRKLFELQLQRGTTLKANPLLHFGFGLGSTEHPF